MLSLPALALIAAPLSPAPVTAPPASGAPAPGLASTLPLDDPRPRRASRSRPADTLVATAEYRLTVRPFFEETSVTVDGAPCDPRDITLTDPHVGAISLPEGRLDVIALPDGSIFYRGDFRLKAQTLAHGTQEFVVRRGEVLVRPADAPDALLP